MGSLRFKVHYDSRGANIPGDMAARLQDLSEPFLNILEHWAEHNLDKFELARGGEFPGVDFGTVTWEGVTPAYEQQKRRKGYEDWLMVRTGSLMHSMTTPDQFYQNVGAKSVTFGQPLDEDDRKKYAYNWVARQIAFFDLADKRMIQANISDYLTYGSNYERGKNKVALAKYQDAEMTAEFGEVIRG